MSDPPQWDKDSVVQSLVEGADAKAPVSFQVFLGPGEADVPQAAARILDAAVSSAGPDAARPVLGKVHPIAKSFSVTAEPDVLRALARSEEVTSILPSRIDDILPKPRRDPSFE